MSRDGQAASVHPIRCATPVPPGGALQPGFSASPDRIAPPNLMLRGDPKVGIVGISQQIVNTKAKGCEGPSSRYVSWTEAFTTAPRSASGIAGFAASDHLLKLRSAERDRILNLVHSAIISDPDHLEEAMDGEAGTTIVPG